MGNSLKRVSSMEEEPPTATAASATFPDNLPGMLTETAVSTVMAQGFTPRVVGPGVATTCEYRHDRITMHTTQDGTKIASVFQT